MTGRPGLETRDGMWGWGALQERRRVTGAALGSGREDLCQGPVNQLWDGQDGPEAAARPWGESPAGRRLRGPVALNWVWGFD